jgi:very-short-patch-repair endonuclease
VDNYQGYNKALRPLAHSLRETATKAEACLWKYALRAGQMKGYTFRRQRPVLNYIADFMCQPLMLIIELDGGIHQDDLVAANDATRQQRLEAAGFTVMRFDNDTVLHHIVAVRRQIETWIEDYEQMNGIPEKAAWARALRS